VARSFENEMEAFMKAKTEQIPTWHEVMERPRGTEVSVPEHVAILVGLSGVYRQAILRVAQEIDHMAGR